MKKITPILFAFSAPVATFAAGLVPCGGPSDSHMCNFNDIVTLFNIVINFFVIKMLMPIAIVLFVWVGITYMTSGSAAGTKMAKERFMALAKGVLFILGAWLIVKVVMVGLGYNPNDLWLGI